MDVWYDALDRWPSSHYFGEYLNVSSLVCPTAFSLGFLRQGEQKTQMTGKPSIIFLYTFKLLEGDFACTHPQIRREIMHQWFFLSVLINRTQPGIIARFVVLQFIANRDKQLWRVVMVDSSSGLGHSRFLQNSGKPSISQPHSSWPSIWEMLYLSTRFSGWFGEHFWWCVAPSKPRSAPAVYHSKHFDISTAIIFGCWVADVFFCTCYRASGC